MRGYIIRPLNPEAYGYTEIGHLEGKDALSAVPPETREEMRRVMKSGKAKITVRRVDSDTFDLNIRGEVNEDD